ncbi:hypothetical protein AAK917_13210, partial [Oscillospiraceae bacterium 52-8]
MSELLEFPVLLEEPELELEFPELLFPEFPALEFPELELEELAFPSEGLSAGLLVVSAGSLSTLTSSSALEASSFVSSEAFGLAFTLLS